jgi:hypothetical protein
MLKAQNMHIYIANLSANASSADFWEKFSHVGIVKQVVIVHADGDQGKDFAMIDIEAFPKMKWKEIFDEQFALQKV